MQAQTDQDFKWVVLDDGPQASPKPTRADVVIRPAWRWWGDNTQHESMLELLRWSGDGPKLVVEDDDAYTPGYVASMRAMLAQGYGLVGEHTALYYHVGMRAYRDMSNRRHASLCSTGFQGAEAHALIKRLCRSRVRMVDHAMWREYGGAKRLQGTRMSVGIKGLPGRAGIGCGHKLRKGTPDPHLTHLRAIIGDDAEVYRGYYDSQL